MRTFACKSLGNKCNWKHIAKTEELLADVVAVHLRDAHGVKSLSPELIGKIKNAFTNPTPIEAKEAENLVLKEFECKNLGNNCDWKYIAQTEELIVDGVAVHARESHGIKEFTPEMAVKVKRLAREWRAK
jgi:predicted small metal-binding protein